MGLLARAIVWIQFKLGTYKVRQITRIERGGVVIDCADSRYQPSNGIRYELSPDEWFLYSYRFFPRGYREHSYDEEFTMRELYYDYFAKMGPSRPSFMDTTTQIFAIFKNKHSTGYIILETRSSKPNLHLIGGSRTKFYSGIHINQWGISDYKDTFESGMVKPIYYATSPIEAATCMLADTDDFRKLKIELFSLNEGCDENPGSCVLHSKLTRLLQDCKYTDLYLEK